MVDYTLAPGRASTATQLSDIRLPYGAPTNSDDFKPSDFTAQFAFQSPSDYSSPFSYQSPSDYSSQFSFQSDTPSQFASSSPYQSFGQDTSYQFSGYGQGQFGQSQFGQSSTSLTADNPFSSSLSGEALGEAFVEETVLELALL
jgi:hypothetical protein